MTITNEQSVEKEQIASDLRTKLDDLEQQIRNAIDSVKNTDAVEEIQAVTNQVKSEISWRKTNLDEYAEQVKELAWETKTALENKVKQAKELLHQVEDGTKTSDDESKEDGEKKWFWNRLKETWTGAWNRTKTQFNKIIDFKKDGAWKTEMGKNVLRVAWLGVGVRWLGKLFWRKYNYEEEIEGYTDMTKKEKRKARRKFRKEKRGERREERKQRREENVKKSFRERPFWKFMKNSAITAWIAWWVYWLGKKLWLWWKWEWTWEWANAAASTNEQATGTEQLKENDPEKFEKYKNLWSKIDAQYDKIMGKELSAWRWWMSIADGYKKYVSETISIDDFRATVPMAIDNEFTSVDKLLSEWWYYGYLRHKTFTELKETILWWGKDKIEKILGPYLCKLTSFIPFKWADWSASLENWLNSWDPVDREAELQLFFRQYVKVINYVQDKKEALKEKIAKEKFVTVWWDYSNVQDALEDNKRVEDYIYSDARYKNFMQWKLYNTVDVMNRENILDDSLSEEMQDMVDAADAERDQILKMHDWKDALWRLEWKWWTLSAEDCCENVDVCKDVVKDLEDNFDKDVMYLYFSSIHQVFNTDENNIQEFLKQSWLNDLKNWIKESMEYYKQKFASKSITEEEILDYKNLLNEYFATKKEILIWAAAIQNMKTDNPNLGEEILNVWSAALHDLVNQTKNSVKHFKDGEILAWWLGVTWVLLVGWTALRMAWKQWSAVNKFWRFLQKSNMFYVWYNLKDQAARRLGWMHGASVDWMPSFVQKWRYNCGNGNQLLLQDLLDWKISGKSATKIFKNWNEAWNGMKYADTLPDFLNKMLSWYTIDDYKHIAWLIENDTGESLLHNKTIRDLFLKDVKVEWSVSSVWHSIKYGFRPKAYEFKNFDQAWKIYSFLTWKYTQLADNQKLLFKNLMKNGEFHAIEELSAILTNIDKIDIEWMSDLDVIRLSQELSKNVKAFKNTDELEKVVKNTHIETVDNLSDVRRAFNETIDKAISKFNELPAEDMLRKTHVPKLEALKSNTSLIDDEMGALVRFTKNWFPAEDLPDLIKLFKLEQKFWPKNLPLWKHLQDLLENWRYTEFKWILCNPQYGKILKNIDRTKLINNFKNVEKNLFKNVVKNMDDFMKLTMKTIAKIL